MLGLAEGLAVRKHLTLRVRDANGSRDIEVVARLDGPVELDYYRQGGIMPAVLRRLAGAAQA